jgi:hypothetical protein
MTRRPDFRYSERQILVAKGTIAVFDTILLLFLIATLLDMSVSYAVYVHNPDYFVENEANMVYNGSFQRFSYLDELRYSIILPFGLIFFLFWILGYKFKDDSSTTFWARMGIFWFFSTIFLISSFLHLLGVVSWLYI